MLSKRGKANGKATANKRPRAARTNRKSKAPSQRPRTAGARPQRALVPSRQNGLVSSSLNNGVVRQRIFGMRFDKAPPHDEFPEGGLRIVGLIPSGSGSGSLVEAKDTTFGLFASGTLGAAPINPTGAVVTATTDALFPSTSPLAVFAQYFRKFRFRKLAIDFTSDISPGVILAAGGAGEICQIAHEPDIVTAEQASASYTIDSAVVSRNCTRFPVWTPNIICPIIVERTTSRSDELYFMTAAGDSLAASGDAALRQTNQGAVTAVGSTGTGVAPLTLGKLLIEFVVDLYGFTNLTTGVLPSRKPVQESKYPAETDGELVDLSPKSSRLQVKPEFVSRAEPKVAPASSRSLSLK